jgi:hypothetical protein
VEIQPPFGFTISSTKIALIKKYGLTLTEQPETTEAKPACGSDAVAESAPDETRLGAPVVHELPRDPGPHECLLTVREVAARLGVSSPLVYKLCLRTNFRACGLGARSDSMKMRFSRSWLLVLAAGLAPIAMLAVREKLVRLIVLKHHQAPTRPLHS